jgi:HK97 family phage portal protein
LRENKQHTNNMVWISRKNIEALKNKQAALEAELKGYYDGDNKKNEYFQAIARQLTGLEMAPWLVIDRAKIKDTYETSAPVMGVVNYIADNVGEVMRFLELVDKDGKAVDNHWLIELLRRPNDRFSIRKFGQAWAINKLLFGDAWVYAKKTVGKDRTIKEMFIIPSQNVTVKRDGADKPIAGIKLMAAGTNKTIKIEDVFESFDYNLDDTSFFGTSKIVAAAVYLSILDKGMRRQDTSLDNGGVAGIITPKADSQTYGVLASDADNVEKEINGKGAINRLKALRTPIEYHAIGSKPVDLNILASHKEAVTALCFVYRLPVDLYYGQSKYENAKEAKKAVYEQQAIPLAEEFAADLLSYLKLEDEFELVVNRDEIPALQETPTEALDRVTKMHGSLNELRTANGFDRIEEPYADEPMIPLGIQFGNEAYDIDENA